MLFDGEKQKATAEAVKNELAASYSQPIVTEITLLEAFYPAGAGWGAAAHELSRGPMVGIRTVPDEGGALVAPGSRSLPGQPGVDSGRVRRSVREAEGPWLGCPNHKGGGRLVMAAPAQAVGPALPDIGP